MERMGTQGAQFIVAIVLARLLTPEDFGLIALVTVFIAIANVFVQSGLNTALIQKKNADNLDFSTVFYASLTLAAVLYGILFLCAPFIATFYKRPDLIPVVRVLGLMLLTGSLNSIQEAYISRKMMFKKLFYRSVGAIIPAGLIGIACAYKGFGAWALVAQQLSNSLLVCTIMWFTVKWRPQLAFSLDRLKNLYSFGWKLLVSALLDTTYNNLQSLVIGKLFTPAALGFYNRGAQFPSLIVNNINASINSVLFPSLSSVQDDREQLKKMTRRAIVTSSFAILPLMAGLAAIAKPLVLVLLGEKWLPAVPFIQICCIVYAFWPIHTSNLTAINATGHSEIFLKLELIKKVFGLCMLAICIYLFRSPLGIAASGAISSPIGALINAHPNKKLLHYGYLEQMRDILPSFVLSLAMGLLLWAMTAIALPPLVLLILLSLIGISFYLLMAKFLHFECLDYLIKTVQEFKNGRK